MNVYDKKVIFSYFTGFSISTLCMNFFFIFLGLQKSKDIQRQIPEGFFVSTSSNPHITSKSSTKYIPTTLTVLKKVEEELGLDIDVELVRTQRGVQLPLS